MSFDKKGVPITILGLPRAGKTTFVNRLLTGEFSESTPTMGMHYERVSVDDAHFDIFDLGGHEIYRKTIWENYIKLSYGFIFVLDSADPDSINEAKEEFWKSVELKKFDEEFLVLFLCNKSDLESSMNLEKMVSDLELYKLSSIPNASYQFFKVSMKTGDNLGHALNWLQNKARVLTAKRNVTPLMFLVAERNGLPLLSVDKIEVQQDIYLISAFLSAVKTFASDVFGEEGVLQFIMSEKHKYIISATEKTIFAILIGINESQEEARRIIELINEYYEMTESYEDLEKFIFQVFNIEKADYSVNRTYNSE